MITLFLTLLESLDDHITMNNDGVGFLKGFLGSKSFLLEILVCLKVDDTDLFGNGGSGWGLITGDHNDLDTG